MIKLKREGLNVRYYSSEPNEIKKLETGLRYYVSGAEYAPSYRQGKWDGYYRFYETKTRVFKYGLLHLVIAQLNKYKIEYRVENDFEKLKIRTGTKMDPTLWQHQKEGIFRFLIHP